MARFDQGIPVDGDEHQATLLIKAQRVQVIVGRNEPHARAIGLPRERDRRIEERRSNSPARLQAVERHNLARVPADARGDQAYHRIGLPPGKTGKFVRPVDDAARYN